MLFHRLLFAATKIHPSAVGSANLWVSHQADGKAQTEPLFLRSEEREGYFAIDQLVVAIGHNVKYRPNPVSYESADREALSVAARALVELRPVLGSAKASLYDSRAEQTLGITHILGVPLLGNLQSVKESSLDGTPISITIDLHFDGDPDTPTKEQLTAHGGQITELVSSFRKTWRGEWTLKSTAPRGEFG